MGRKSFRDRCFVRNYTNEVSAMDIRFNIIKLLLEDKERGITSDAGLRKSQYRHICQGE